MTVDYPKHNQEETLYTDTLSDIVLLFKQINTYPGTSY